MRIYNICYYISLSCNWNGNFRSEIIHFIFINNFLNLFRLCPFCRTEIQCWTSKKFVKETLGKPGKQEKDTLDEHRQKEEVTLVKQSQEKEVTMGQHKKHEEDCYKFCELCFFNSPENFLHCLTCLYNVRVELSCFEIMLILRTNLAIGKCPEHLAVFIGNSNVSDVLSGLQLVEQAIGYILINGLSDRMKMRFEERYDDHMSVYCFRDINSSLDQISLALLRAFPKNKKQIDERFVAVSRLINEMDIQLSLSINRRIACSIPIEISDPSSSVTSNPTGSVTNDYSVRVISDPSSSTTSDPSSSMNSELTGSIAGSFTADYLGSSLAAVSKFIRKIAFTCFSVCNTQ